MIADFFETDFDGVKSKVDLLNWYNQSSYPASLPEMPWLAMIFWPYLNHIKPDFDGIKSKIGPLG